MNEACLTRDELASCMSGAHDERPTEPLRAHLHRCASCRERLDALASTVPATPLAAGGGSPVPHVELAVGTRVGRYVVTGRLGAGAMGVVYAAHDPELDRQVALKLLRRHAIDAAEYGAMRDRLRREAQAMAQLAHPHVVAIHDVGNVGDQIFIAMEHVEGQTLAQWLATAPRSWRDVLAHFVAAGAGLAAAHAAGLVHRDFKPENVLVSKDGRVLVGDFGLARAIVAGTGPDARRPGAEVDHGAATLTATGGLVGTPYYMAPEQLRGAVADARTDQFNFCVALWAALTGEHPFARDDANLAEAVLQGGLRRSPRMEELPRWLRRVLARGLLAAPAARHPSMEELLRQLTPERRRRGGRMLAAAATAAALLGAVALTWFSRNERLLCTGADRKLAGVWDAERAHQVERVFAAESKPFAAAALAEVRRVLDGYAAAWVAMRRDACTATRMRHQQSEELLELRMMCLDDRLRELGALTSRLAAADSELIERAPRAVHALGALSRCADAQTLTSPVRLPVDPKVREQVAELRRELAEVKALNQSGRYREGRERVEVLGQRAAALQYRPVEAEVRLQQGLLESALGDGKLAEQSLQRASWAADAGHHDEVGIQAWLELMTLYASTQARYDEALALRPRATALIERLGGNDELDATLHLAVARIFRGQRRYLDARGEAERALAILERRFGPNDLRVAEALSALGEITFDVNGSASSQYWQRVLAIRRAVYGDDHPETARALEAIAGVNQMQHKLSEARAGFERVLAITERARGPEHRLVASELNNLAVVCNEQGESEEALRFIRRAVAIDPKANGDDHPNTARHLMTLGDTLIALRRYQEALFPLRQSLAIFERRLGAESDFAGMCRASLADALAQLGRNAEARAEALRAVAIVEKAYGPTYPYLFIPLLTLGRVEIDVGAVAHAIGVLERARVLAAADNDIDAGYRSQIDFALAQALVRSQKDPPRARALAEAAYAAMVGNKRLEGELAKLERWMRDRGWSRRM